MSKSESLKVPPHLLHFPRKLVESLPYWIAAALVALVSALYMKMFTLAEEWSLEHVTSYWIFILPVIGIVGSMTMGFFFSRESLGTGIPQVIAATDLAPTKNKYMDKLLGLRVLIVKPIASTFCILFGGVTGREGPTLHISASVFYLVTKYWPKKLTPPSLSSMVVAGGAAGLAAAFNTPLGGIAFAVEELSKAHLSQMRTTIFQAVIIAGILSQILLGNYLYFGTIQGSVETQSALWQTVVLAVIIGAVAGLFSRCILTITKWNGNKKYIHRLGFAVLCGFLLSVVIYFCGSNTLGAGKSVIAQIVNGEVAPSFTLVIGRIFGNIFTFCGGVVGGVFAPSLASGAALAQWLTDVFTFTSPHLMIMVGMVAFLTGVTRAPLTSFILVMEMSNSHDSIMYLILSSLVANSVSKLILYESFSEQIAHVFVEKAKAEPA